METTKIVNLKRKGIYNEKCNRTDCDNHNATFYNYSTRHYYCPECAKRINEYNYFDALRMYGHDLCIEGEYKDTDDAPIDPEVDKLIQMFSHEHMKTLNVIRETTLQMANYLPESDSPNKLKKGLSTIHVNVRTEPKIGRNDKCTCGSNKKYKQCCGNK